MRRAITENRETLEPIAGRSLRHLCYPSSVWSPREALTRFLDGANVRPIAEAGLYDYLELMRPVRAWAWRLLALELARSTPLGAAALRAA